MNNSRFSSDNSAKISAQFIWLQSKPAGQVYKKYNFNLITCPIDGSG